MSKHLPFLVHFYCAPLQSDSSLWAELHEDFYKYSLYLHAAAHRNLNSKAGWASLQPNQKRKAYPGGCSHSIESAPHLQRCCTQPATNGKWHFLRMSFNLKKSNIVMYSLICFVNIYQVSTTCWTLNHSVNTQICSMWAKALGERASQGLEHGDGAAACQTLRT